MPTPDPNPQSNPARPLARPTASPHPAPRRRLLFARRSATGDRGGGTDHQRGPAEVAIRWALSIARPDGMRYSFARYPTHDPVLKRFRAELEKAYGKARDRVVLLARGRGATRGRIWITTSPYS